MPHYNTGTPTRAEATPPAWLPFGANMADFVNTRSGRNDIIGYVGPDAGHGAAACFSPQIAEIELDVAKCFGEDTQPQQVGDINKRDVQFEWPQVTGALSHEAAHAEWSSLEDLILAGDWIKDHKDPRVPEVVADLEETRIESLALDKFPNDVGFMRACALGLSIGEVDLEQLEQASPYQFAKLLLLTLAREDVGVLREEDVESLLELAIKFFGMETFVKLRSIWLRAQLARPEKNEVTVWDKMVPLAEEWLSLLPEEPSEDQQSMMAGAGMGMIIIEIDESAMIGGQDQLDEQETQERNEAIAKAIEEVAKEIQEHQKKAQGIFGHGPMPSNGRSSSEISQTRPPKDQERQAAIIIGNALEKARYTDRVETEVSSRMPPGRLNTNAAIMEMAQRDQGMTITAQPWRQTQRRQVDDPEIKLGVVVDISGSMDKAMEPMAVTAWVMANAGHRVEAQVGMAYFGNSVFATLWPGQQMPEVVVRTAPDGSHEFEDAFKAIDGILNLIHGSGARLLVICSDTYFGTDQDRKMEYWVQRCVDAGVGVLILPFDDGRYVKRKTLPPEVQVIPHTMDPTTAALVIGQAAVKALESVSRVR